MHQYCLRQISKTLTVKEGRRRGTVIFAYVLFGIIIATALGVIIVGIVYCAKEIRKKEELVLTMKSKRVTTQISTQQGSTNTEMNDPDTSAESKANPAHVNTTMQPMELGRR